MAPGSTVISRCPYLEQVHGALPRILGSIDGDASSATHGLGDRRRWAWRASDFADATWQIPAAGLAILIAEELLPEWLPESTAMESSIALVEGLRRLIRPDGSLEEAFPRERSWCVTAFGPLVIGEVLLRLGDGLPEATRTAWSRDIVRMQGFLMAREEAHGRISNHRATVVAALLMGPPGEEGPATARARAMLESLLDAEAREGWWPEYGGFDPAYQSLCMHYLSWARRHLPESDPLRVPLADALNRGFETLSWFVHGDLSFGGAYGRRGGQFLVPSAAEMAMGDGWGSVSARRFSSLTRAAIRERRVVALEAVADANAAVLFTAYCLAAGCQVDRADEEAETEFPLSGERQIDSVLVRRTGSDGMVVDLADGTVCRFDSDGSSWTGPPAATSSGAVRIAASKNRPGAWSRDGDALTIHLDLRDLRHRLPNTIELIILRLLGATVFAWPALERACKRAIVSFAFGSAGRTTGSAIRRIDLTSRSVEDSDVNLPPGFTAVDVGSSCLQATASRGYWQRRGTRP